jgi:hypothetical protein
MFMDIWYIIWILEYFCGWGILYQEKSGIPALLNIVASSVTRLGEFSPNKLLFTLVRFLKKRKSSPNFCATISRSKDNVLILSKIVLGYILGDFFTN